MDYLEMINDTVTIPEGYKIAEEDDQVRNGVMVHIVRLQPAGEVVINGPRIIGIFEHDALVSLKDLSEVPSGTLLDEDVAVEKAEQVLTAINPEYGNGEMFLRVDYQEREFFDEEGELHYFPVQWIKFAGYSGNYAWATLGSGGKLIEVEYESEWDYFRGRRKTEMWDNDDWIQAYYGQGPQLASPNALA